MIKSEKNNVCLINSKSIKSKLSLIKFKVNEVTSSQKYKNFGTVKKKTHSGDATNSRCGM